MDAETCLLSLKLDKPSKFWRTRCFKSSMERTPRAIHYISFGRLETCLAAFLPGDVYSRCVATDLEGVLRIVHEL